MRLPFQTLITFLVAGFGLASVGRAGSATGVNGLFYTGVNNSGGLLAGGTTDSHWSVNYANAPGTDSNYQGAAYVVSGGNLDGGWVANTSSAQWITAPGATTNAGGSAPNTGGDYLPGNGTTGTNAGQYVYRLAFTITGTGTGSITNDISISLTIAADDQYKVYVNPTITSGEINTTSSTLAASRTGAWNNTQAEYLQNYAGGGHADNANFVIGTNYIYVVVDNTNSQTGTSGSTALNPSGLIVYQVGSAVLIDGKPVPEVGAILPVLGALGLFALRRFRLRNA
jgi:hypothetical protein